MPAHPQPRWRVSLDGQDISSRMAPRLVSLSISTERGQNADQLDITLTDHDGRLDLPRRGVRIDVAIGWDTSGLVDMGTFTVDEVEHAGTPDKITLRARSAPVGEGMREKRTVSYHDTTLGDVIRIMAGRQGLTPRCAASLASIHVTHIDQTNESDANILSRLGQLWDAVSTVKAGCLIFAPVGKGTTATGATLPTLALNRSDGDQHRYHSVSREAYTGVRAYWHDTQAAEKKAVVAGDEKSLKTLRTTYATQADATAAAKAEWQRVQRGEATFSLHLARGTAGAAPEVAVRVSGWHPLIDETPWLIKRATHNLNDSGYTTDIECEIAKDAGATR